MDFAIGDIVQMKKKHPCKGLLLRSAPVGAKRASPGRSAPLDPFAAKLRFAEESHQQSQTHGMRLAIKFRVKPFSKGLQGAGQRPVVLVFTSIQ